MGKSKIDTIINLMTFKRKYQFLKREHLNLKSYKMELYNFRFRYISGIQITKMMLNYIQCKKKDINVIEQTERSKSKTLLAIKTVKYFYQIIKNLNSEYQLIIILF